MTEQDNNTSENTQGESTGQGTANGSGADKMFSQDEVNKMIKGKAVGEMQKVLNEIGFQSVDELKTLVKQKKERDESEKSELQKAVEKASQLEKERESWQSRQKETAAQYDVAVKAAKLGIVDPDAAWKLLDKSALEYVDDKPSNTELLLQGLLKDKPYLAGGGSSAANPAKSRLDLEDKIIAEARKGAGLQ